MATKYYNGDLATGLNDGSSWANAWQTFGAAATGVGADDVVLCHYAGTEDLAADTAYSIANNCSFISVDKDNSDALTPMSTTGYIGHSTLNRTIRLAGGKRVYFHGLTFRIAGSSVDDLVLSGGDGCHHEFEDCYFWQGNTATTARITFGFGDAQVYAKVKNCTWRFGHASQRINVAGALEIEGGSITNDIALTTIFEGVLTDPGGATLDVEGFDMSNANSTATIVGDATTHALRARFTRCDIPASATWLGSQTVANNSGAVVWVFDCNSGDTHITLGHYDSLGSTISDATIYFTSGAAAQSWKIVSTANAHVHKPYYSPWIDLYNSDTSTSITPYMEAIRDGAGAASISDNQLWGEWSYKNAANSVNATFVRDRMDVLGSSAVQTAGTDGWTGDNAGAYRVKLVAPAPFTPSEVGHIRGRFVVGEASATFYCDPQIRT